MNVLNNIRANKTFIEFNEFKKHIDAPDLSQKNINKLYATLRNKIKKLINYGVKNL